MRLRAFLKGSATGEKAYLDSVPSILNVTGAFFVDQDSGEWRVVGADAIWVCGGCILSTPKRCAAGASLWFETEAVAVEGLSENVRRTKVRS